MEQNNQAKQVRIKNSNAGLHLVAVLLIAIIMISSSIGLYAWAKYTKAQSGNATAQIAKWYFNLKTGEESISGNTRTLLELTRTDDYGHVSQGKIAPGTHGELPIVIDTTGTEVDLQYTVVVTVENCPTNMTFSSASGSTVTQSRSGTGETPQDPKIATITITNYLSCKPQNQNGEHDETLTWNWPYETFDTNNSAVAGDAVDKDDNGKEITVRVTATGTEMLSKPLTMGTLKNGDTPIANGSTINLGVEDTTTLSVEGAENVTYSSSDTSKVTVNSTTGAVSALAAGSAVITITGVDSHETMTVNVVVAPAVVEPLEIGTSVNYSTTLNDVTLNNWKVFLSDEDYTYLIYGDYLPTEAISESIETTYGFNVSRGGEEDYGVEIPVSNVITTTSNWEELVTNGSLNDSSLNLQVSQNVWAMGSPTLELWVNSWNAKYPSDTLYIENGYEVRETSSGEFCSLSSKTGYNNTLYFPRQESMYGNCEGYWLPEMCEDYEMYVGYDGSLECGCSHDFLYAFRPVIKLPTSVVNQ